jgi:HEAT repeat protein
LIGQLENGGLQDRINAARIIGNLGLRGKPAVPALVRALSDKSSAMRKEAALCMAGISELSDEAALALIKTLKQDNIAEVRAAAATAMGHMIPMSKVFQQVLNTLKGARNDPDPDVRERVKDALQFFGQ